MTSRGLARHGGILGAVGGAAILLACTSPPRMAGPGPGATLTPVSPPASGGVSAVALVSHCHGPNAEVETATAAPRYVYDAWIGCGGIGFARSTDGGLHFGPSVTVPGSAAGPSWDPAIAVAPGGTVYVSFMHAARARMYPVVAASSDHGVTFPRVSPLLPARQGNWGDRDFIAVSRTGVVYLTWDYGPSRALVKLLCSPGGSCAYKAGDLNAVIQRSTDGGKTWGPITPVGPNFPRNGADSAPVLVEPNGRVDLLAWGHYVSQPPSFTLHPGHEYFSSSATGTAWPVHPVEVGASAGPIALPTWWIDGDLGRDQGGNLYATWDTQTPAADIGWLSFSTDDGRSWSAPARVTPDHGNAVHIMAVLGGPAGTAYVAWQTNASPAGYATYLRPYSIEKGWLGPAIRVSSRFGNAKVWPGDSFGIAPLPGPGARVILSWGSAIGQHASSQIYAAAVRVPAGAAAR